MSRDLTDEYYHDPARGGRESWPPNERPKATEPARTWHEIMNQHDPNRFDPPRINTCPQAKYPAIVREDPDTWPIAWRGFWQG